MPAVFDRKMSYLARSITVTSRFAAVVLQCVKRYPTPGKASITQIVTVLFGIVPW